MPTPPAPSPGNASRPAVPIAALLGLREGNDPALWARIRATQLFAGRQLALFLLAANLVAAAIVAMLFAEVVPLWQLGLWGALVAVVAVVVTVKRLRTRHLEEGYATLAEVRDTLLEGVALAAVWSVPPLFFSAAADSTVAFGLWMILSVLMTAAAVAMAALVLAAVAFVGGVALAVTVPLALAGADVPAAATMLFAALLIVACVTRARALVLLRGSELTLTDREETVSLLLRESQDSGADWLWETDAQRRVIKASPRFAYAVGLDPVTIDGMPFLQVLAGSAWDGGHFSPGLHSLAERLKARDSFRDLAVPVTVNGEQRWWEIAASPRHDESGTFLGFRGVGSDITERRAAAEKINRMARFDPLTSLPNRLSVNEALTRALTEAEKWGSRCAFMIIDLDRFKAVNDTLGHPIGDRLLGRVAERLGQLITDNALIGRLGGDEFAVVINDASDPERLEMLAQSIIGALKRPYDIDQHALYIGASIGIAASPSDGRTAETLIRSADLALYRAKDAGGGTFRTYEPQLHADAEERRVLEMALRTALELGQMHLAYQPVVEAGSERLTGFEALLRWTHPELGSISPARFVRLAEETGLIGPIGEWVLRSACEEAARWPDDIRIAVNVSPEQLHNSAFTTIVASALVQSGLRADRLELDVTERVFLREGTGALKTLERVLDLGVRLSLDDFGTGYSSLGFLGRTRFSSIKIDRSFVTAAATGAREAVAIVRAVVAMATSLDIATIAEGVETEAELTIVRDLGCTRVQGYYFGRPLPVTEARAIAHGQRPTARAA